jgi:hypothetical protein
MFPGAPLTFANPGVTAALASLITIPVTMLVGVALCRPTN